MTGQPTRPGPDNQNAVDVLTAAARLGITPDAVRKRIARGQLPGLKRDGRWFALLDSGYDTDTPVGQYGQDTDRTSLADQTRPGPDHLPPDRTQELLDQLRGENAFLREENRRKDTIIAALIERQRQLPGPDTTVRQDTDRTASPLRQDDRETAQPIGRPERRPRPRTWRQRLRAWLLQP